MTIYYTSDLHIYHDNLIKSKFRDFKSSQDCAITMLNNINRVVKEDDILYILGDITMINKERKSLAEGFLKSLNTKRIIILKGNHDEAKVLDEWKDKGIIQNWYYTTELRDIAFHCEVPVFLSHYPVIDYHSGNNCTICLHGHSHGKLKRQLYDLYDVGVDCNNFKPVTLEQILEQKAGWHGNPYSGYIEELRKRNEV